MGYEMYRLLSLKKSFITRRKKKNAKPSEPVIINVDKEDHQQELIKGQYQMLIITCFGFAVEVWG